MNDAQTGTALALVALVPAIFATFLPPVATVRAQADDAGHQRAALRTAVATAGTVVLGVAVLTRNHAAAAAGGLAVAGFALMYGHAATVEP